MIKSGKIQDTIASTGHTCKVSDYDCRWIPLLWYLDVLLCQSLYHTLSSIIPRYTSCNFCTGNQAFFHCTLAQLVCFCLQVFTLSFSFHLYFLPHSPRQLPGSWPNFKMDQRSKMLQGLCARNSDHYNYHWGGCLLWVRHSFKHVINILFKNCQKNLRNYYPYLRVDKSWLRAVKNWPTPT